MGEIDCHSDQMILLWIYQELGSGCEPRIRCILARRDLIQNGFVCSKKFSSNTVRNSGHICSGPVILSVGQEKWLVDNSGAWYYSTPCISRHVSVVSYRVSCKHMQVNRAWSCTWILHDHAHESCMSMHRNRAWSCTWIVHDHAHESCMIMQV